MPPAYVGAPLVQPSADAGTCILTPTATMIRPKIGGSIGHGVAKQHLKQHSRRHTKKSRGKKAQRKQRKSRKQRAGFLPSIGEPFAAAAGKYVAPIALYGLYKFLDGAKDRKKGRKSKKSNRV